MFILHLNFTQRKGSNAPVNRCANTTPAETNKNRSLALQTAPQRCTSMQSLSLSYTVKQASQGRAVAASFHSVVSWRWLAIHMMKLPGSILRWLFCLLHTKHIEAKILTQGPSICLHFFPLFVEKFLCLWQLDYLAVFPCVFVIANHNLHDSVKLILS